MAPGASFNHGPRTYKDQVWAALLISSWVASVCIGAYTAAHSHLEWVEPPDGHGASRGRLLLVSEDADPSLPHLLAQHWLFAAFALAGGVAMGALLLRLVARHSLGLTRVGAVILALYSGVLLCFVLWLGVTAGSMPGMEGVLSMLVLGLAAFVLGGLLAVVALGWRRIELAGRLLGVAARGLVANPVLFFFMAALMLVGWVAFGLPLGLALASFLDGRVLLGPAALDPPPRAWCFADFETGRTMFCWAPTWRHLGAAALLALEALWAAGLCAEVLMYVVGGVAAQWHGAEAAAGAAAAAAAAGGAAAGGLSAATAAGGTGTWRQSKQRLGVSLRHALGPSLGSLALSSLPFASPAIFLAQALARAKEDIARHGRARGALLHAPARCLRGLLVSAARAATITMAWSGEGFLEAAAGAAELITWRYLLVFFYAVWFNALALSTGTNLLSLLWMLVLHAAYALGGGRAEPRQAPFEDSLMVQGAYWVAVMVMAFVTSLLLNVARAVVVLWLAERDAKARGMQYQPVYPVDATRAGAEMNGVLAPLLGLPPQQAPDIEVGSRAG